MKLKFLLLLLFLLPRLAFGAVAIDADSSSTCTSCPTLSWSHTVGASATLLLCSVSPSGFTATATGVTWNISSNMTQKSSINSGGGGILTLWELASPTVGTHTVTVTASATVDAMAAGCTSFTGTGTLGSAVTVAGGSPSALIDGVTITVPTDGMAFGAGFHAFGACVNQIPETGNTERYDVCADAGGNNAGAIAVSRTTTGALHWTDRPSGANEAIIGVPINPTAGPAGVARRRIIVIP